MSFKLLCNGCSQELVIEATNQTDEGNEMSVRPCSTCILANAKTMSDNVKHHLLHTLNASSDRVAEEIKTEVHHKLVHTFTTAITQAQKDAENEPTGKVQIG